MNVLPALSIEPSLLGSPDGAGNNLASQATGRPGTVRGLDFAQLLNDGIETVNGQLIDADAQIRAFAIDDSIPVHQVTIAMEQARLSFELMLQVRNRLVEGYQQLMNMQL